MSRLLSVTMPSPAETDGILRMNGKPTPIGGAMSIRIEDVENFWGGETELETANKAGIGSAIESMSLPGMTFTIKGVAYPGQGSSYDYEGAVHYMRSRLVSAFSTLEDIDVTVTESYYLANNGFRERRSGIVTARRSGEIRLPPPRYNSQEFEVSFFAPDPRKRMELRSINDTSQRTHPIEIPTPASYTTSPFIRATLLTPVSSAYIQHNGLNRRVSFGSSYVPAGTIIDFAKRQTIHPADGVTEMLSRPRGWFELQPGLNHLSVGGRWKLEYWLTAL